MKLYERVTIDGLKFIDFKIIDEEDREVKDLNSIVISIDKVIEVLDENESLCMDDRKDRHRLLAALVQNAKLITGR